MALDNVRIKIVVDDAALQPTINKLEDLGATDSKNAANSKKNADDFANSQKKIQDSINKTGQDLGNVGKANKGAFATEQLNTFNDQLNKVSNTAGQSAQKFNTLQYSINNITREMPAFANSVQTGFMAISNNIPMVIDEVTKLRKANLELAASGQPTNSIFKTLLGSIFSWGTALSVGVTLLTMYGAELINVFTGAKDLKEEQDKLTSSTKLANDAFDIEERRLRALGMAETELIKLRKERIKQNLVAVRQEIKLQEQALTETLASYAKGQALVQNITGGFVLKPFFASQKEVDATKAALDQVQLKKKELTTQLLELDVKYQNEVTKIEDEKNKKDKKKKEDKNKDWEEALREFERISNEQERIANIEYKQFLKDGEKAREDAIKVSILQTQEGTQERLNAEIDGIRKEVEYKLTNAHLSEDTRFVIIQEAEEKISRLREKYRKDEQKALDEAQKRREELLDAELKALEDNERKKSELRNAQIQLAIDVAGNIANATFAIEEQNAQDRYRRRLEQLEEQKNAELDNKKLTEDQKLQIQKRFDQQTEQLQKQEFERQKNFKIAQAIINTALAVTNALATGVPPFNVIQAIAIGAQGAAQIAIIENEKFAKGGLIGGKLHRDGGTVIEAEKDEYVINRKDTMANLELIENINKGKGEEFIFKKYVLPAVIGQKEAKAKESGLFAGIMDNMALNGKMFDDYYLRKAIEKSGKENAQIIVKGLKENQTYKNTRQF